jgi:AraC-like DNA-binding protein
VKKIVFSSDQLPDHLSDHERFRLWADIYADQVCAADFSCFGDGRFFARSDFMQFGEICVTQAATAVETFSRRSSHVAKDGRDDFLIGVYLNDSRSRLEQRGREIELSRGSPYIVLSSEPLSNAFDSPNTLHGMVIPRNMLAERVAGFAGGPALIAPSPAWQHLDRYLSMLLSAPTGADSRLERQIENHLADLVALALGAHGDSAELARRRGLRAVRLREVVAAIEHGFADPAFAADDVAKAIGLSRRYVNELLYEAGASFTERVLELRLQKARSMLVDARHDAMKVSDIALACGFNEVSYFNRRFRARFGCSPTQYRGGGGNAE